MGTVFERVQGIIVEQLGVDPSQVTSTASFVDDLNADLRDFVELILSIEEEFSNGDARLEIDDEEAEKIHTVQDVVDFLKGAGVEDK